ncbi:Putative transmembrane protein (Alph_Pro_TM) [Jannaschia seosinensis]|uniref:Putative transmembrane protein (Alph_Pro_TM) n=1 Tax=Jannaschia seosinensis TaxID=313367 RepID=A0A0M7B830_9RHOB|nr:TIGR02186 family protein [Jannaschia seosinensis]CUH38870.1 Putative transmembrane protein (Alph_Pro_TM) [Jannaschia seosinensis]
MIRAALLLLALALPAQAEDIVADLSQDRISISTSFSGSEILVYGAIRREAPIPENSDLAVIVTVAGPREDVTVRRKERRFGIWVNTDAAEVRRAPSFYAVASSAPLDRALSRDADLRYGITTPRALGGPGLGRMIGGDFEFLEALIRVNTATGVYGEAEQAVEIRGQTLFSTTIELPSNLTEGNYDTRIFLTRDGDVIDSFYTSIFVQKVGLERWIYTLAHEWPLIYGILSLAIAIVAGWGASALFRWIRV